MCLCNTENDAPVVVADGETYNNQKVCLYYFLQYTLICLSLINEYRRKFY